MIAAAAGAVETVRKLLKEAESCAEQDPMRARALAEEALRMPPPSRAQQERGRLEMVLAFCCQKEDRPIEAIDHTTRAVHFFEEAGEPEQQYAALKLLNTLLWNRGDYTAALQTSRRGLACAEELGDAEKIGRSRNNIGVLCFYLGEYESAIDNLQHSVLAAQQVRDRTWECNALSNLGNIYANMGDDVRALEYQFRSLDVAETYLPDRKRAIASTLMNIGAVFQRTGDYEQALDYLRRSHVLREEVGDRMDIGMSLHNIGLVYKDNHKHDSAREYLLKSMSLFDELGALGEKSRCLVNLAGLEKSAGNIDDAERYGREALAIAATSGDRRVYHYALHHIGHVYSIRGEYGEALPLLTESLGICREIGYVKGETDVLITFGDVYSKQGHHEKALEYLYMALDLMEKMPEKPILIKVHRALAHAYECTGDTARSLEHFKAYHTTEKEVFNESSERRLRMIQTLYQVEEAKREAEIYRLKNEQLEQQVGHQTKELAAKAMYLSQRSDLLFKIRKELLHSFNASKREATKQVRDVVQMIDATLDDQQTWNAFEEQFKQVHHTFVELMKERYPALSATELKVCALIKINLSSKEICRLLNVSPRSVDIYRHRIRKKMGLSSEENLASFLAGLH